MRYFYLTAALIGALTAAGPAAARSDDSFYVNAVYLFNTLSEADAAADTDFDGDNGQAGYFGYRLLPGLALEAGGVYFDPIGSVRRTGSQTTRTEHEVSGYTAGLRGMTSFAGLFDIWLAAGLYSWDSTFNYEIQYPNFPGTLRTGSDSHSGEDAYYRVGVTLPLTDSVRVTVESAYFELNDFFSNVGGGGNVDLEQRYIGLGFEYSF
jgi:hypothetical protein